MEQIISPTPIHEANAGDVMVGTALSAGNARSMRKIFLLLGVAITVFLAFTIFSVFKTIQSSAQLSTIRYLYFPVLERIDANIVRLDKMVEQFLQSVMLGDLDPLKQEVEFNSLADATFKEMVEINPERGQEIVKLQAGLRHFHELATQTSKQIIHKSSIDDAEQQAMNGVLFNLKQEIRSFRQSSYDNFIDTLNQSQLAVKQNLYLGTALGVMNLGFIVILVLSIRNNVKMMSVVAEQNESLEKRVAQRTIDLETTVHDLRAAQEQMIQSEKMASLGQLVASVAHEINTPISVVRSSGNSIARELERTLENMPLLFQKLNADHLALFLSLIIHAKNPGALLSSREERAIRREVSRELEVAGVNGASNIASILVQLNVHSSVARYLPLIRHPACDLALTTADSISELLRCTHSINTAVNQVSKIVFALKSLSRSGSTDEWGEARLQDGIETVLTVYHGQIKQGTELVCKYEEVPPLRCLPDQLIQVWTNLVHNALQAMGNRGTLTIGLRRLGDEAVVSVGDTGCGIPEEIRGKIFEAFFTTKPAGEGSGLGLDIVRKIVEVHRGRIELHSEVGVGSTFSVYLPLHGPAQHRIRIDNTSE